MACLPFNCPLCLYFTEFSGFLSNASSSLVRAAASLRGYLSLERPALGLEEGLVDFRDCLSLVLLGNVWPLSSAHRCPGGSQGSDPFALNAEHIP